MNNLRIIFTLTIAMLLLVCNKSPVDTSQMVNPLLGEISYISKFGHKPDAKTDDNLRVRTHLEYVENLLRNKDVSTLSADLIEKRTHLLDLLHDYWTKGVFPKNYDYADQRKPCFIDKDGSICAVGYLIEQTTTRQVAEGINRQYKYDDLLAMNNSTIDAWVLSSGLTKEECAMIQPNYAYKQSINPVYGITSSALSGLNLSLITVNGIQIGIGKKNNTVPIIGLITGVGQIALGSTMFPQISTFSYTNDSKKTLSMLNIGLGTTTMILSAWNLLTNRNPKDNLTTWNFYTFPTLDKKTGMTFSLTRRF